MSVFSIALSLFFVLNSVGNVPFFVGILSRYTVRRQRRIILRELLIALFILLIFNYFGDAILNMIGITHAAVGIGGGILLFLISLSMIFPKDKHGHEIHREPLVFPLATPAVAGPGSIAAVMIYSQQIGNPYIVTAAVLIAWVPSVIILLASSNIKLFLGQKGLFACERLGGMLICLIAIQMMTNGIATFISSFGIVK